MTKRIFLVFILLSLKSALFAQVNSFVIDSSKFIKHLVPLLDTIYTDDQADRLKLSAVSGASRDSLWKIIREKDAQNLVKVNSILDKYGWLGPQDVGMNGSQSLFLVIQHAGLATQEKYLPLIKKAEHDGKILSSNLAILQDRINVRKGENQLYGSQGFTDKLTGKTYIYPVTDPDHIDDRRKAMGLQPIADYLKILKITWNIDEYKKLLPEIEAAVSRQNTHQ